MKSLWNRQHYDEVVNRVAHLTPEQRPLWGQMTCPQMVVHMTDSFGMYCGDLKVGFKNTPIQYFPLKHAFLYVLPIPKNVPTAKELKSRAPAGWDTEIARLRDAIARFGEEHARTDWPLHPSSAACRRARTACSPTSTPTIICGSSVCRARRSSR